MISRLLAHGTTVHADQEVVTWTADGGRRLSFADLGTQAARLAAALRGLGVTGDQRVATFMWNNAEHLEAYLAVPSMGAVLHTLNIRLFPDQLIYVANHAAGPGRHRRQHPRWRRSRSCSPTFGPITPRDRQRPDRRPRRRQRWRPSRRRAGVHELRRTLLAGSRRPFDWPEDWTSDAARRCATPPAPPATPRASRTRHRSIYLHSMAVAMADSAGAHARATGASSSCRCSTPTRGDCRTSPFMAGASMIMPDRFLQAEPLARDDRGRAGDRRAAPSRPSGTTCCATSTSTREADTSLIRLMVGGSAAPPALMHGRFQERHGIAISTAGA